MFKMSQKETIEIFEVCVEAKTCHQNSKVSQEIYSKV